LKSDLEIFKVRGHNPEIFFQQAQVQHFKNVYFKNHQSKINRNMFFRSDKVPTTRQFFSPNFDLEIFKVKGHNPEKLFQQVQVQHFKNVYAKCYQTKINRNMVFRSDKVHTTRQFFSQTLTLKFLRLRVITLKNYSSRHRLNILRMFMQKIINLR